MKHITKQIDITIAINISKTSLCDCSCQFHTVDMRGCRCLLFDEDIYLTKSVALATSRCLQCIATFGSAVHKLLEAEGE